MRDFFIVEEKDYDVLYHVNSNKVFKINKSSLDYTDEDLYKIINVSRENNIKEIKTAAGKKKISLNLMSSRTCNLGCKYCFAGEGEYGCNTIKPKTISRGIYEDLTNHLLENYKEGIDTISFFGGEPLIDYKNIKEVIPFMKKAFKEHNISIPKICLSTNSVLLTDEVMDFCVEHDIELGLSLDGPKELNDLGRRTKGKSNFSTYDRVYETTLKLIEREIPYKLQMTLNKNHLDNYKKGCIKEWMDSLSEITNTDITVCPVTTDIEGFAISSEEDYEKLDSMAREFVHYYFDEYSKGNTSKSAAIFITPMLFIVNKQIARGCAAGEKMVLIDTDGSVYPCQMYCNDEKYKLGDVVNGFSRYESNNNTCNRVNNEECQNCIGRNLCTIWCKGLQLLTNGKENSVLKERCVFQRAIIEENLKILSKLSEGDKKELKEVCKTIYYSFQS